MKAIDKRMKNQKLLFAIIAIVLIALTGTIMFNVGYNEADKLTSTDFSEIQQMYSELETSYSKLLEEYSELSDSSQDKDDDYILPSTSLATSNPIDTFYEDWGKELSGVTIEMNIFGGNYAASWQAEMLHAYEVLLENANPHSEQLQNYITDSRELFLDFVECDAYVEGLVYWSDGFWYMRADVGNTQEVHAGSGFSSGKSAAAAALYKQQTLRIYDMLDAIDVEIDYIFNPDEVTEIRNQSK